MKISVIVPSFNQARYLDLALASIAGEARDDIEVECIVFDGGSNDGSADVLRSWEERMKAAEVHYIWSSEKDRGQTDAINRGMAVAQGDVLAYLNSDDQYLPGALERVAAAFRQVPSIGWVTGRCLIVDSDGRPIQRFVRAYRDQWLRHYSVLNLRLLNFIAQPATFWSREAARAVGTFDESLSYAMDYDFWLRLAGIGKPVVVPQQLAAFRIHGASKGGSAYRAQFQEDYAVLCRYEKRKLVRAFHWLHNAAIVGAYRFLK